MTMWLTATIVLENIDCRCTLSLWPLTHPPVDHFDSECSPLWTTPLSHLVSNLRKD